MDEAMKARILALLDAHRIMTLATLRSDGWPQATTVGYGHDGLAIYFLCGPGSQKAANIDRDDRVSATIDHDVDNVMAITGLSMAAHARPVDDPDEARKALALIVGRYAPQPDFPLAMPTPDQIRLFRLEPKVISVLDYSKGFAHTDLVMC